MRYLDPKADLTFKHSYRKILYARTVSWTSAAAMQKDVSLSSRCK